MTFIKQKAKEFDKKFREYVNAGITYAELQEVYKPLDFEDEVKWIQDFMEQALEEQSEEEMARVMRIIGELLNK